VKAPPEDSASRAEAVAVSKRASATRVRSLLLVPLLSTPFLAAAQSATSTREYRYLMGTSVEIEALGADADVRRAAVDEAFAAMAEVDRLMSNYREDSELSLINRTAAHQVVRVSDPMSAVLQAAEQVSVRSGGAFDVTVGPLVTLWGFHDKKPHLPTAAELTAIRPSIDYHNVVLDAQQHTVRFARAGVAIDLGGIAKGFAVELAAGVLRRHGLTGFVDAGGNQYLLGTPPGKPRWTVGVKNPDAKGRLLGVIDTPETSVSTSADNANFFNIDGRSYGHILDPHTLQPSNAALSVTILSRDGTLADAMSKAAFILGPKAGLDLIDSFAGMSGLIAYRKPGGGIGIVMSAPLQRTFHPAR
jgi:thiamine biosynthesis lipoprotein